MAKNKKQGMKMIGMNGDNEVYAIGGVGINGPYVTNHSTANAEYAENSSTIFDDNGTISARPLTIGNKKYESGQTDIKVGDEVIIYGKLMNYKGNTPETVSGKAYLYSLNGKTE